MANVRIVWNTRALYTIRTSAAGLVNEQLQRICDTANSMSKAGGFQWESHQGQMQPQGRWRGTVFPATARAMRVNQRDNTLVRAVGGGG